MMAGIDAGCTLLKVVYGIDDKDWETYERCPALLESLKKRGIRKAFMTGLGIRGLESFDGIEIVGRAESILDEITIQAEGVRYLLEKEGLRKRKYLIVSIGTGTSYVMVKDGRLKTLPHGNSLGGGFLLGAAKLFGIGSFGEFCDLAEKGDHTRIDLLVKDKLPEMAKHPLYTFPIANLGKATRYSKKEDVCAALANVVAVSMAKDVSWIDLMDPVKDILFIGTALRSGAFSKTLREKTGALGKRAVFLKNGEYSGAVGAYMRCADPRQKTSNRLARNPFAKVLKRKVT